MPQAAPAELIPSRDSICIFPIFGCRATENAKGNYAKANNNMNRCQMINFYHCFCPYQAKGNLIIILQG
jgi:hypothetical protein